MNRHNFKKHVQDLHPGMPVRERVVGLMSFGQFVSRMSNNRNDNEERVGVESEPPAESLLIEDETATFVEEEMDENISLNVLNKRIKENHQVVMQKLEEMKNKCDFDLESGSGNKEPSEKITEPQTHLLLERAKTLNECFAACPEFEHDQESKAIFCSICWTRDDYEKLVDKNKQTGVIKYVADYADENDEKVSRDMSNIKMKLKRHLETQKHKSKVVTIENKEHHEKNSDEARIEKEAAMRCARLCHFLYMKGRPFRDYPELVATIVQGGSFMGDINHSKRFPHDFLQSVAAIVGERIKNYLKTDMKQTGFKPPVKVVADKDTYKHRTRQVIALITVFPYAQDLIQHIYVAHPIVKKHSGRDVAENLHNSVKDFISTEQYQGGSYDGAYIHDSVHKHLNEIMEVKDEDTQNDWDALHKSGVAEKHARKEEENNWVNEIVAVGSTCFRDINFGKSYEEALEIAEAIDIDFEKPKFHSDTRFANHGSKVFKSLLTDLPVIIERYKQVKNKNLVSNEQKKRDKGIHASNMLKKIDNKKFILSLTGLVDIYSHFSVIVSELQCVNKLPFERFDKHQELCNDLKKKAITVDDHSLCDSKRCSWPQLHKGRNDILNGRFPVRENSQNQMKISSDEGISIYFTRSVKRMLDNNSPLSFEKRAYNYLKKFVTSLYQHLSGVFTVEDKATIENSRKVTDWISLAIKLKDRSVPVFHTLDKQKYTKACFEIDRTLRQFKEDEISSQYRQFLNRLKEVTKDDLNENLEHRDPKDLIKQFLSDSKLYTGIEVVLQACMVGAIKISVESVAESMISKYNIHNSKIRPVDDITVEHEMMIDYNGPDIGEADGVLMEALHMHFKDNSMGIHFNTQNIFRSRGVTVETILSRKSRLPLYNK